LVDYTRAKIRLYKFAAFKFKNNGLEFLFLKLIQLTAVLNFKFYYDFI